MAQHRKYSELPKITDGVEESPLSASLTDMLEEGVPAHKLAEFLLDYFEADQHVRLNFVDGPYDCMGLYDGLTVSYGKDPK